MWPMRLNLLLMWQHSLGLRSHDHCPESSYQWDVNFHVPTNPSAHSPLDTHVFHPPQKQIITPQQPPLAPVHHSHLSAGCLNYFISLGPLCQSVSLTVFLVPLHYFINMWLGHQSEKAQSAHTNASWHAAPFLLSSARRCHFGRTTCLLKCLSITSATGAQRRANRKQALAQFIFLHLS